MSAEPSHAIEQARVEAMVIALQSRNSIRLPDADSR
jgi:hypothetical protein